MIETLLRSLIACTLLFSGSCFSQVVYMNGAIVHFSPGSVVYCNGGSEVSNASTFTNNGTFTITKNSSLPQSGNLLIKSGSTVLGNGTYKVEQDWINDATFTAGSSTVQLYGNTQQYITSTNGTNTTFNNLTLSGNGTASNRKKTLLSVNATISASGILDLKDRELETQTNDLVVLNNSTGAITNTTSFGNEGFISSIAPGFTYWTTSSTASYLFPVGSSNGTLRYRPAVITPKSSTASTFSVRFNNYDSNIDGYNRSQTDGTIDVANDQFYHSIERTSGTAFSDIDLYYLPADDGDWTSIAHWTVGNAIWKNINGTGPNGAGNYSYLSKNSWDFTETEHPFILTTLEDVLIVPNVFTPNNDGVNDSFKITSKNLSDYHIVIINRWGNPIFESDDVTQSWDGTTNGEMCTEGVYFFQIVATSKNKKEYKEQGFVTLKY